MTRRTRRSRRWAMRPERRRSRYLVGPVLAVLVSLSAACSSGTGQPSVAHLSGSGGTVTSTTLSLSHADEDLVNFARCLRAHGVDEPDPQHVPGHSGLSVEIPQA